MQLAGRRAEQKKDYASGKSGQKLQSAEQKTEQKRDCTSRRTGPELCHESQRERTKLVHTRRHYSSRKRTSGNGERADYTVYRLSRKEWAKYAAFYLALDGSISYLFFNSWIAFCILLPGGILFIREQRTVLQRERAARMAPQFLDGIQMAAASLQAGYSVENAFREAGKELEKIYPQDAFIVQEFRILAAGLDVSCSLESLLMDLGRRSGVEDIRSFAEIFLTARRTGSDLLAIIRNTVSCIRQKQETMQEIETCLAGKVMEQNIMSLVPILILAYVKLTSPEFLAQMYGNVTGVAVMLLCFLVYALAYFWGRRIVRIEV